MARSLGKKDTGRSRKRQSVVKGSLVGYWAHRRETLQKETCEHKKHEKQLCMLSPAASGGGRCGSGIVKDEDESEGLMAICKVLDVEVARAPITILT